MKIKPVILCGGSGSRLWPRSENNTAKQFIDFGGWTLLQKTLDRIKDSVFDYPIISTNSSYLRLVRKYLKKNKIKKFKIILEPFKKNTAAAILSSALLKEVSFDQPMIFFPADHLIQKKHQFIKSIKLHKKTNILDNLGKQDITSLVNFQDLIDIATKKKLNIYGPIPQKKFLTNLGIQDRKKKILSIATTKQKLSIER